MNSIYEDIRDHLSLLCILFVSGLVFSFPFIFIRQYMYDSLYYIIFSSFVTWLFLENWVLRKELREAQNPDQREKQKYDELQYIQLVGELTMQNAIMASANETLICELTKFKDMKTTALHWQMLANKTTTVVNIQNLSQSSENQENNNKMIKRSISMQ